MDVDTTNLYSPSLAISPLGSLRPNLEQSFNYGKVVIVQTSQMETSFASNSKRLGNFSILAKESIDYTERCLGTDGNAER